MLFLDSWGHIISGVIHHSASIRHKMGNRRIAIFDAAAVEEARRPQQPLLRSGWRSRRLITSAHSTRCLHLFMVLPLDK